MDIQTEVALFRRAADVRRWHTQRRPIVEQTVGQHSFNMLLLLRSVAPEYTLEPSVLGAIIHHDLPEAMTGDIPAPVKRDHVELGLLVEEIEQGCAPLYQDFGLSVEEERLVKWLDLMELVLYTLDELEYGNRFLVKATLNGLRWLAGAGHPTPKAAELFYTCVGRCVTSSWFDDTQRKAFNEILEQS